MNIKFFLKISLVAVFLFSIAPVSQLQANCAPKADSLTVTPRTVSNTNSTVEIKVVVSGTATCTQSNVSNVRVSVPFLLTGYTAISWDLALYVANEPGQSTYTLEGTSNIFSSAPGINQWRTIRLYPMLQVGSRIVANQTAFVDLNNPSGTQDRTYNSPAPADAPIVIAQTPGGTTPTTPTTPAPTNVDPTPDWDGTIEITNRTGGANDLMTIALKVINWMLLIIAMAATIMIIYAGIMLVFNGGNESRVAQAKSTLTWAIIGLVVAIGAFALVSIIQGLL